MPGETDFQYYIFHGKEERYLEYKRSMIWTGNDTTKVKIAKAMMAMANLRNGGVIVVGMQETARGIWEPEVMTPEHAGYVYIRGAILFTLTEIFRFAVGLAQGGILDPMAFLSVELHNTKDYMLVESFDRFFPFRYVNEWDTPITYEKSLPANELSATADKMALDIAIKVFSVFGWIPAQAAIRNLVEDQKKLIERRL